MNKLPIVKIASVKELESPFYKEFMDDINTISEKYGLRVFTCWSKLWEYPWLWYNGLGNEELKDKKILDIGSEISPMPWFMSMCGADVSLVERDTQYLHKWENIKNRLKTKVSFNLVPNEKLPFEDNSFDVVTSFSVIEHQPNKKLAVDEICRVLKPGGLLAISFDLCEKDLGMSFPSDNGVALDTKMFEDLIWKRDEFYPDSDINWNWEDVDGYLQWHKKSGFNYITGAFCGRKKS